MYLYIYIYTNKQARTGLQALKIKSFLPHIYCILTLQKQNRSLWIVFIVKTGF